MITEKVKNLFGFINFLHNQTEYFLSKKHLIDEVVELLAKRDSLKPNHNYNDRIEYNKIQKALEEKFDIVEKEITNLIEDEIRELDIANINTPIINLNAQAELYELQRNFDDNDLAAIFDIKRKYLAFRTTIDFRYFLQIFFDDLDRDLKEFFGYFKDSHGKEFEAFETKTIQVNDIHEAVEFLRKGYKKFTLPNDFLNPSKVQQPIKKILRPEEADTRFLLYTFVEEQEQNKHRYKHFQREIENKGFLVVKTETDAVKIYTPELAIIFTSKELPARNIDTLIETKLNGWEYFKTYIQAYKEGEQYFEDEFKVSANTLYGANAEQYVRDLHLNFFHVKHTGINEGWGYVKKEYPFILTDKAVREFGYYAGIVNKVEEQVKKYPQLFAAFDKCEYNLPPQHSEAKTKQEINEMKPVLKPEAVQTVFELIKDFFSTEQQTELLHILKTGNDTTPHLIFLDNGNRLADAFKQLKKADAITGCEQKELENWICRNFKYRHRKLIKEFKPRYLNDIISTNKDKCQNPILNVTINKATGEIKITKS